MKFSSIFFCVARRRIFSIVFRVPDRLHVVHRFAIAMLRHDVVAGRLYSSGLGLADQPHHGADRHLANLQSEVGGGARCV